ncbi:MAG: hypothetical protein HC854_07335 [Flavobacterium sp.]|nr:hypothetical protein [Flavobacterium sp.]
MATNSNSISIGTGSASSGSNALSIGLSSSTTNNDGVAVGNTARASGLGATALGFNTNCQGNFGVVLGNASNITGTAAGTANSVAIGNNASVLGTDCIAIGTSLTINTGLNNAIGIGNSASVTVSNRFQLGNTSINSLRCQVALTVTSDGRFKYDVKENVPGLDFISKLRPVTYKFDKEKLSQFRKEEKVAINTNTIESGFIAQEVEETAKSLGYSFNGISAPTNSNTDTYGISYSQFVVPLVKAVQEQQTQIEDLKKEVEDLKRLVEKLVNK